MRNARMVPALALAAWLPAALVAAQTPPATEEGLRRLGAELEARRVSWVGKLAARRAARGDRGFEEPAERDDRRDGSWSSGDTEEDRIDELKIQAASLGTGEALALALAARIEGAEALQAPTPEERRRAEELRAKSRELAKKLRGMNLSVVLRDDAWEDLKSRRLKAQGQALAGAIEVEVREGRWARYERLVGLHKALVGGGEAEAVGAVLRLRQGSLVEAEAEIAELRARHLREADPGDMIGRRLDDLLDLRQFLGRDIRALERRLAELGAAPGR